MTVGLDDADDMLEELGEDVTIGAVTAKGIFRRADELILDQVGGGTIQKTTYVIVKRGRFPVLAQETPAEVQGTAFKVRKVLDLADPRFTRVEFKLA